MYLPPLDEPVTNVEALDYHCPTCGQEAGQWCRYTQNVRQSYWDRAYSRQPPLKHRKGARTERLHKLRKEAVKAQRQWEWNAANPHEEFKLRRQELVEAAKEYELREAEQLRSWLLDWGWILWEDARPDGSRHGEPHSMMWDF